MGWVSVHMMKRKNRGMPGNLLAWVKMVGKNVHSDARSLVGTV